MIEFAKKLKNLNKFDVKLEGNVKDIIKKPKEWAKAIAEFSMIENIPRYKRAKKLGKEFADGIKTSDEL